MVIIRIQGGLGNQMFQYALYRKLQFLQRKVKVDTSWYLSNTVEAQRLLELKSFPINLHECSRWEKWLKYNTFTRAIEKRFRTIKILYKEKNSGFYLPEILRSKHVFLDGYWQSEKYFYDIREILLKDFTFPISVTDKEETILERIQKTNSVSIQIRRGDYLNHMDKYGNICTKEYYYKAIQYMEKKQDSLMFYIFSDDMDWAKKILDSYKNVYFVELGNETDCIHDMKLMASCKHNIIANSSFSWWASWLNQNPEKIIIAPCKWQNGNTCQDIWCSDWIRVSAEDGP